MDSYFLGPSGCGNTFLKTEIKYNHHQQDFGKQIINLHSFLRNLFTIGLIQIHCSRVLKQSNTKLLLLRGSESTGSF